MVQNDEAAIEVCLCASAYEVMVVLLARKRRVGERYEDVAQQASNEAQRTDFLVSARVNMSVSL